MKNTMNENDFKRGMQDIKPDNFSYEGLSALWDYLEKYEDRTDEQLEFNPRALCCNFTEYADFKEVKGSYRDLKDMDDLRDNTQVIEFDSGIIIQNY